MDELLLTGKDLSIEDIYEVSVNDKKVKISEDAYKRVEKSRKLIFELADKGVAVYGLNRGVGWNKDKRIFNKYFEEYNTNLIYAHCVGVGDYLSEEEVRAVLLCRLNTLLLGATGMDVELINTYKDFLNYNIHPLIPKKGSVGEADITTLSFIGLSMIGEGEVFYKGNKVSAKIALEKAGLKKASLGPKDGLGIVSSNAFSAGKASLILKDLYDLLEISNLIYCLSLEGLNGNISPLDDSVNKLRGYKGQYEIARKMRGYLEGSYLNQEDENRALHDALSFRGGCSVHGAIKDSLDYAKDQLKIQLNSSDDNPCIIVDEGRLMPSSNYETTSWVLAFEMMGIALSHMSKLSCHRIIKLSNPEFTKLNRFLTPSEGEVIAFGTIQKTFTYLDTEIRHLSNPVTADFFAVAGEIEDHANNTPMVIDKLIQITDNLKYILAIELLHAIQAIGLRGNIQLGNSTGKLYEEIRKEIDFLSKDRPLYIDINKAYNFIKSKKIISGLSEELSTAE